MLFGSLPNSSKKTNKTFQIVKFCNIPPDLNLQTNNKSYFTTTKSNYYQSSQKLKKTFSNRIVNDCWQVLGNGILIKPIINKNYITEILNIENLKKNSLVELKEARIIGINYFSK